MTTTKTKGLDVGDVGGLDGTRSEPLHSQAQLDAAAAKARAEAEASAPPPTLASILDAALGRMDARALGTEKPIETPWPDFNESLPGRGFWPGCHVLVAGTGVGKSTWALQLALHAARQGTPVAYIGLELDSTQIALRLVADVAKLHWSNLYTGQGDSKDRETARAKADSLRTLPFYVEHGSPMGWSAADLQSLADRMRRAHPGDAPMLLVLDFLQILGAEPDAGRQELRERIGRATYVARQIARTHNAAVLVISSLARGSYNAAELIDAAKPVMDIVRGPKAEMVERRLLNPDALVGLGKESGEIEYAADSVIVALRVRDLKGGENGSPVLFALPKLRAGRETWCELRFNGSRFNPSGDFGKAVAAHLAKPSNEATPTQAKATKEPSTIGGKMDF